MSTVYVAGSGDGTRARAVMDIVEAVGHRIAHDWTTGKPTPATQVAAIRGSDTLVYLYEPGDWESARIEVGIALALGIPVVCSPARPRWFLSLPGVTHVTTDTEIPHTITTPTT